MSLKYLVPKWYYCTLCRAWFIECPECGNNCCNAMYGPLIGPDEGTCTTCLKAYEYQYNHNDFPKGIKEQFIITCLLIQGFFYRIINKSDTLFRR